MRAGDDRTWGQWIRGEWWWRVTRKLTKDHITRKVAWLLPRYLAYWCFIRVYSASGDGPGPEYVRACDAWEGGAGR